MVAVVLTSFDIDFVRNFSSNLANVGYRMLTNQKIYNRMVGQYMTTAH